MLLPNLDQLLMFEEDCVQLLTFEIAQQNSLRLLISEDEEINIDNCDNLCYYTLNRIIGNNAEELCM